MQTTNSIYAQLPICSSLPTLQRNNSTAANQNVRYLQQSLVKKGDPLTTDGFFGTKTEQAVIKFQKQNKIAVDGIVGPKTWSLLGACYTGEPGC
ncbi:peptidoglycan-binding domain-containing protein [Microcoleus sp. N3A4]|uniref:peptidoglycan-binding domain-containing protein n=1 Tax=Microcoleus sp. N3A4 TaxID=3055379 RepID=UPI002FCFD8FD